MATKGRPVGWRCAYPTYRKPLKPESGVACLLSLNFPATHLHRPPLSFFLYLLSCKLPLASCILSPASKSKSSRRMALRLSNLQKPLKPESGVACLLPLVSYFPAAHLYPLSFIPHASSCILPPASCLLKGRPVGCVPALLIRPKANH